MKQLFILWLMFSSHFSQAQSIIETFMNLPDSVCPASKEHRSKVFQQFVSTLHDFNYHAFRIEKLSSSYILLTGLFEGTWELKKWKLKKNENLVGISLTTCGPVCSSNLFFFKENSNSYEFLPAEQIFPTITPDDYYNITEINRINPLNSIDSTVFSSISWTSHFYTKKRSIRVDFEEIESGIIFSKKVKNLLLTN
jgi:hypothetical protein